MRLFLRKRKPSRLLPVFLIALCFLFPMAPPANASDNIGLIMRGVTRTLFSAFEIPKNMLANSTKAFPFGLLAGAVAGTARTIAGTLMGVTDIARGGAPYAKYLIFL